MSRSHVGRKARLASGPHNESTTELEVGDASGGTAGATENFERLDDVAVVEQSLAVPMAAQSILTLVISFTEMI